MAIELVRIDDRLIHGQVATTWINDFKIEQVIVVDDHHVNDEIQKQVLAMTAPAGIKLQFFGVDQFDQILGKNPINRRSLLLYTNPVDVLRNLKGNLKLEKLNVGNIRFKEGRRQYSNSISLSPEEVQAMRDMMAMGVEVTWQMVPRESPVSMDAILEKNT